jgi:circadian clock protein KaiC
VSGPPGTGKSTLTLTFALAAARRGEKVAIYTFDESLGILSARAAGLNLGLDAMLANGTVTATQIDPAELSPGELASRIQVAVEQEQVKVVLLDSLNGYLQSMSEERFLNLQLHELVTYLNQQGVVTMLTVTPHGLLGNMQSPVDVTYLADAVVTLRFFEAEGALHRAISAIKKRTGDHERTIRELFIAPSGVTVGPPLTHFRGVLTGVPIIEHHAETARTRGDDGAPDASASAVLIAAPLGKDAALAASVLEQAGIAARACRRLTEMAEQIGDETLAVFIAERHSARMSSRSCSQRSTINLPGPTFRSSC